MESYYTSEKIFHFLTSQGYHYTTEKGMIESCRDGRVLLKIASDLIKQFEPAFIRMILATECHQIGEEKHRESLPAMSDIIVVREILKAINVDFKLNDLLRPTTDRILFILGRLVRLADWKKKIYTQNDVIIGKMMMLQKQHRTLHPKLTKINKDIEDVRSKKLAERPQYQQKMKMIGDVKETIMRLRNQRNEYAATKMRMERDLSDKKKEHQQITFSIEQIEVEIVQVKKQLSINAPEIRKEKLRQDASLQQALSQEQQFSNFSSNILSSLRNRLKTLIRHKQQAQRHQYFFRLEERQTDISNKLDSIMKLEEKNRENSAKVEENLQNQSKDLQQEEIVQSNISEKVFQKGQIKSKLEQQIKDVNLQIQSYKTDIDFLDDLLKTSKRDQEKYRALGEEVVKNIQRELQQISKQAQHWNLTAITLLLEVYRPFGHHEE